MMFWQVVRTWRFWKWWVGLLVFEIALWSMPRDVQVALCTIYERHFASIVRAGVDEVMGGEPGAAPSEPGPATAGSGVAAISPEDMADHIRGLVCLSTVESESARDRAGPSELTAATGAMLPTSFVVALFLCLVLPARTHAAEDRGQNEHAPEVHGAEVPARRDEIEGLKHDCQVLGTRAKQLRVALCYALLSGLSTALCPPNFTAASFLADTQNRWHIFSLVAVACVAAAWGAHRLADGKREALVAAAAVGFGGIFIGGLIALSISLPYRMITPIEEVRLQMADVGRFAAVRLALLPILAGMSTLLWIVVYRAYHKRPLNVLPQRRSE